MIFWSMNVNWEEILKYEQWDDKYDILASTRYGCPKKMAEQKFYETIAAIKKEREAKAAEEKKIEEKFDPK